MEDPSAFINYEQAAEAIGALEPGGALRGDMTPSSYWKFMAEHLAKRLNAQEKRIENLERSLRLMNEKF